MVLKGVDLIYMVCLYIFISFYPKVVGIVGDGASSNRRFFKLQDIINEGREQIDGVNYKVKNLFAPDRFIYLISDMPHLLKTARNSLETSGKHNKGFLF